MDYCLAQELILKGEMNFGGGILRVLGIEMKMKMELGFTQPSYIELEIQIPWDKW